MTSLTNQILVVEQNGATAQLLNENHTLFPGYQVLSASSAKAALELLDVFRFDLIDLDLPLADMNPNRFLEKLGERNISFPVLVTLDPTSLVDLEAHPDVEAVAKDTLSPQLHLKLIQNSLASYQGRLELSQIVIEESQVHLKGSQERLEQSEHPKSETKELLEHFWGRVAEMVKTAPSETSKAETSVQKRSLVTAPLHK